MKLLRNLPSQNWTLFYHDFLGVHFLDVQIFAHWIQIISPFSVVHYKSLKSELGVPNSYIL